MFNYSFIRAKTELDLDSGIGYAFILLQLCVIFLFKTCFKKSERFRKKCEHYLFLKTTHGFGSNDLMFKSVMDKSTFKVDQRDELNEEAIKALKSSYEHPWLKIRKKIEFIQKKQDFKVNLIQNQK